MMARPFPGLWSCSCEKFCNRRDFFSPIINCSDDNPKEGRSQRFALLFQYFLSFAHFSASSLVFRFVSRPRILPPPFRFAAQLPVPSLDFPFTPQRLFYGSASRFRQLRIPARLHSLRRGLTPPRTVEVGKRHRSQPHLDRPFCPKQKFRLNKIFTLFFRKFQSRQIPSYARLQTDGKIFKFAPSGRESYSFASPFMRSKRKTSPSADRATTPKNRASLSDLRRKFKYL